MRGVKVKHSQISGLEESPSDLAAAGTLRDDEFELVERPAARDCLRVDFGADPVFANYVIKPD